MKDYDAGIARLIALIPQFEQPSDRLYSWKPSFERPDSAIQMGYHDYGKAVDQWWSTLYDMPGIGNCHETLEAAHVDPRLAIKSKDFDGYGIDITLALMLWLTRAERFCDGIIAEAIDGGILLELLRHLKVLTDAEASDRQRRVRIMHCDITRLGTDAIMNAANTALAMGGGVCGAIFQSAGPAEMQRACEKLAPIATGEAVITPSFRLPARFVIHTAGPVWHGGTSDEETLLRACYRNSLVLAAGHHCRSIAFPLISAGIYGYPRKQALCVARQEISSWTTDHPDCGIDVTLVLLP